MEYVQLHATYAEIYTLDKLWTALLSGEMPTGKYGNTKLYHEIKDQFSLIIHYKKIHMENIPEQIENPYTVQFLKVQFIRTNLDYTEQL